LCCLKKKTAGRGRRLYRRKTRAISVNGFGTRLQPDDFVLQLQFAPLQFGELEIVSTEMGKAVLDFTFERPMLLLEIG
jgi:hypothetical protein